MDNFLDSFNEHADSLREARKRDDFDNLQHSLSGVETGQQVRHGLSKDTSGSVFGDKRKTITEQIRETLEWLLLNNPQYKVAHENFVNTVRSAQNATQSALDRVGSELISKRTLMKELLSNAAKLPDGVAVFEDKEGKVRNENGEIISDELAATIEWSGHEPSYEDYLSLKNRIQNLEQAENELRGIDTELGEIYERGHVNTAPLSQDDLRIETDRANVLKERVQEIEIETISKRPLQNELHSDVETLETNARETTEVPIIKIGK